MLIFNGVLT